MRNSRKCGFKLIKIQIIVANSWGMPKDNSSIDRKSFANGIFFQTGFIQVKLHVFKASKQYVLQQNDDAFCILQRLQQIWKYIK